MPLNPVMPDCRYPTLVVSYPQDIWNKTRRHPMHYQPKSQPKPPTPMENSLAVIIAAVALVFALSFKAIAVVLKVTGKVLGFMLMSMGDDEERERDGRSCPTIQFSPTACGHDEYDSKGNLITVNTDPYGEL